jgi:hypothetical protein
MKKIISFCLWGNNPKYCIGAIKNSELYKTIYPDWICRFYIGSDVDINIISRLIKNDCEIIIVPYSKNTWINMLWRFKPITDSEVDIFICRDTDSRLSLREKFAVDEWLESDKSVHIMRDHPYHSNCMLGGMIGFKRSIFEIVSSSLRQFTFKDEYGTDYNFFNDVLYPCIKKDSMQHGEFLYMRSFPTKRIDNEFVGEVFDENENTTPHHTEVLKNYQKMQFM